MQQKFGMRTWVLSLFLALHAVTARALKLEFIGDYNLPTEKKQPGVFGGISGLALNPLTGTYYGICDDSSQMRWYDLKIDTVSGKLKFEILGRTELRREDGTAFADGSLDAEGIVRDFSGRIYVLSEGDGAATPRIPPSITKHNLLGVQTGALAMPAKFLPEPLGVQTQGVPENSAFEGLTISPDGKTLIAMTEGPLLQDDTEPDLQKGSLNRGLVYTLGADNEFALTREFVYPDSPFKPFAYQASLKGSGVSEVLALDDKAVLVLERKGVQTPAGKRLRQARIYLADISAATDVSNMHSLQRQTFVPAKKELVFDFDTALPQLSPEFPDFDNLEGMAYGPPLPTGEETLYVISDNNFNNHQRTQLVWFKLVR